MISLVFCGLVLAFFSFVAVRGAVVDKSIVGFLLSVAICFLGLRLVALV